MQVNNKASFKANRTMLAACTKNAKSSRNTTPRDVYVLQLREIIIGLELSCSKDALIVHVDVGSIYVKNIYKRNVHK